MAKKATATSVSVSGAASAEAAIPKDPAEAIGDSSATETGPNVSDAPQQHGCAGTDAAPPAPAKADATAMLDVERAEFRAKFPRLTAAIEAWSASSPEPPRALRVVAKVDGFRRAGMAHTSAATEHPLEAFPFPEPLEALLAEPMLTVDFV